MRVPVVIVESKEDINLGMKRYNTPPNHGMLFLLKGMYSNLTMVGMKFPLRVVFMDRSMNILGSVIAYPGDEMPLPFGTYYMLEIPL